MDPKPRREKVLRAVIEEYITSGEPVGSLHLSQAFDFAVASSTIRGDLAFLEEAGMLAHPHTSAGRVPTDAGYRRYVDEIVGERQQVSAPLSFGHERALVEIDEALSDTAEALSRVTHLLAVVSAPSLAATTIRHIEVLRLHAHSVMVVIITTSGSVTKRMFSFAAPVDEGLAEFARVYLNERLAGVHLGTRLIESAFASPDLGVTERRFLDALRPAFEIVGPLDAESLHMGGTSRLLERLSDQGAAHLNEILEMLEQRYDLLELLYGALRGGGLYLRIGHEIPEPLLQACSLVAANYGVANRTLGTVSVLGPTRMDYQHVIGMVQAAADELSAYLEEVW